MLSTGKKVRPSLARQELGNSLHLGLMGQAGWARLGWGVASAKRTLKVIVFERFS